MRIVVLFVSLFTLIASLGFFSLVKDIEGEDVQHQVAEVIEEHPAPWLISGSSVPVISARGALIVDIDSDTVLYQKNSEIPYLPASTTKIMTALTAMEYYDPNEIVVVPRISIEGQKMGLLPGEEISIEALLYGTLVFSGNDAAEVLAYYYPSGREGFVERMNSKAQEIGLVSTNFENPTGLDEEGHLSTAGDLVRLAQFAMKNKYFSQIVGTENATVASVDSRFRHKLSNINTLLGEVDGVLGVKTGWTEEARENLVTMVDRDGRRIIISMLGSDDRFGETKELIEWVYGNYSWEGSAPDYSMP